MHVKKPEYPAALYKKYRPVYPQELFELIYQFHSLNASAEFITALDVATGTGQTALELTKRFSKILAVDTLATMLKDAFQNSKINYMIGDAETFSTIIEKESIDLITCSTAAHWFDMEKFYDECFKCLKPSGTVAIWAYGHFVVENQPEISRLHMEYSTIFMEKYWDQGRVRLDNMYSDPDFTMSPFPIFSREVYPDDRNKPILKLKWSLEMIKGYLLTWSCYKNYKALGLKEDDPIDAFIQKTMKILGTNSMDYELDLHWPIVLILAKKGLK